MSTRKANNYAEDTLSRRDQQTISHDPGSTIKATTISFAAGSVIEDSGNGFHFAAGDTVEVRGSALNSGRWQLIAAIAAGITVVPATIQTEAAGPLITIVRVDVGGRAHSEAPD